MSGMPSPARTLAPVSGSRTSTGSAFEMVIGLDQCSPLSVERITAWNCVRADGCTPDPFKRLKMSTRVPFGWTAIWFPIEKTFAHGAKIGCAVSQLSPPSVDLLTRMAEVSRSPLAERLIWYRSPFGAKLSHGSDARS